MGQNQQKDAKGQPVKRAVVHGRGGVRTGTMSDALVQPAQRPVHQNPNALPAGGSTGTTTNVSSSATATNDPQQKPASGPNVTIHPEDSATSATEAKPVVLQTPVVLRYRDPKEVPQLLVEGGANVNLLIRPANLGNSAPVAPWTTLKMTPSDDNFYVISNLAAGEHEYRFEIGGVPHVDASQAAQRSIEGDLVHSIVVNPLLLTTGDDDDIVDDGEGWNKEVPKWDETRKYPPQLPAHLRYTPLNTPPTQVRCVDGELSNSGALLDSENLPLPLSVTINHVYFQRRVDHVVVGMTTRYNNKYTTVAYYKHLPAPVANLPSGAIPVRSNNY